MLLVPMFNRQVFSAFILAIAVSIGGSSCVTNKKKQAAAAETAMPAAAYPDGVAPPVGEGAANVSAPHNYGSANSSSAPAKPQPF